MFKNPSVKHYLGVSFFINNLWGKKMGYFLPIKQFLLSFQQNLLVLVCPYLNDQPPKMLSQKTRFALK
jgi:hypothetical protein